MKQSPLPQMYRPALKQYTLDKFLDCPEPPRYRPTFIESRSLRVLTIAENLQRIEKRKKKVDKEKAKAERAKIRDAKKLEKSNQQQKRRTNPQKASRQLKSKLNTGSSISQCLIQGCDSPFHSNPIFGK